jgi:hypothetical protein
MALIGQITRIFGLIGFYRRHPRNPRTGLCVREPECFTGNMGREMAELP